jgi:hypothetical protein
MAISVAFFLCRDFELLNGKFNIRFGNFGMRFITGEVIVSF